MKKTVSPKAQKRMTEFKKSAAQVPAPAPPNVLPEHVDLEDAAFGRRKKK